VVAHELTHGITDYTSGLFYYFQSGAINEGLSDVFGELVDQWNGQGNDTSGVKWLIGEDLAGYSGGLRNMADPTKFGDPDKTSSANYTADAAVADSGGVHTNSGVTNKAAYQRPVHHGDWLDQVRSRLVPSRAAAPLWV